MMIGLLQLRPSAGPCQFCPGVSISDHAFSSHTSLRRRRVRYAAKGSCKPQNCSCSYKPRPHVVFYHQNAPRSPSLIRRECQRIDNRSETSRDEGNGVWVNSTDEILKRSHLEENEMKGIALDESQKLEDGKDLGTNGHVDNMSLPEKFNNSFEDEGNGIWIKGANEVLKRSQENEQKGVALDESQKLEDGKDLGTNGYVDKLLSPENLSNSVEDEAWDLLRESMVYYCGTPVGTIAAKDPSSTNMLNYDQVFIRDFIPSGIAFLLKGEYEIVRNFILHTLQLQSWEKTMDCHSPGQGLMPASFKVRIVPLDGDDSATEEVLDPDFGESAIGRVAPVDSGLWWIILLRAYGKCSGDRSVQERIDVQTGIIMILKLCLADGFDMFPTLLVTDGSCMIDRRMGIHGHPLEIQALFYSALHCAREMLAPDDGSDDLIRALNNRLVALSFHIREYYWIDMKKLNEIYRYKTEEYSYDAVNKFNIYPDQIPPWLVEWMADKGGYLIGNLQPAHLDFCSSLLAIFGL